MFTVGYSECAYSMPRISFLPPAAFCPDVGSNTPILITLPSASEAEELPLELLPHPASRPQIMQAQSTIARIFFIFFSSLSVIHSPHAADNCVSESNMTVV